jgi:glutathione S-transferase
MLLYYRPGTASMAPHAALAEIGVEYELVRIDRETAQADPAYRSLNPTGVVPTLVDGDLVLTETAAILLYLADRFPEACLAPSAAGRPQYYRWLVFLTNSVQTAMLRFLYPERYGDASVEDFAAEEAGSHFDLLDRNLDSREWLVGEHRTGADLFLFTVTRWGRRLEPPAWDRSNLRAHFARTLALPGVARMMEEQDLELPDWVT